MDKIEKKEDFLGELFKGAGISFVFGIIGYFLMFLFKLLAARYFGPRDYGLYEMITTILLISLMLARFGIPAGILRFIPYFKSSGKISLLSGYLRFAFIFPLSLSFLISIFLFLASDKITEFFGFAENFSTFIKIVSFFLPMKTLSQILRQLMVAEKKIFYESFSANFLEKMVLLLGMVLIYICDFSILTLILMLVLSILISFVFDFFLFKTRMAFPKTGKVDMRIRDWIGFSLPLFFTGFFAFFIQWSDNLIIGKYLDAEKLGIYAVAFSLGSFLLIFQAMFTGIFSPLIAEKYAQKDNKQISFLFKKAASWTFGLSFPALTLLFSYGKEILNAIYGSEYVSGFIPLIITAAGIFIFVAVGLNECVLILHKKTKVIFKINLITAIYNFFACIILVKMWGIIGASVATSSSFILKGALAYLKSKNLEEIKFDSMYNLKLFFISIVSALGILVTKNIVNINDIAKAIIIVSQYAIVYVGLIYFFKIFKREDKEILNRALSKCFSRFKKMNVIADSNNQLNP